MGCDYDANVRGIFSKRGTNIVQYGTFDDELKLDLPFY